MIKYDSTGKKEKLSPANAVSESKKRKREKEREKTRKKP